MKNPIQIPRSELFFVYFCAFICMNEIVVFQASFGYMPMQQPVLAHITVCKKAWEEACGPTEKTGAGIPTILLLAMQLRAFSMCRTDTLFLCIGSSTGFEGKCTSLRLKRGILRLSLEAAGRKWKEKAFLLLASFSFPLAVSPVHLLLNSYFCITKLYLLDFISCFFPKDRYCRPVINYINK